MISHSSQALLKIFTADSTSYDTGHEQLSRANIDEQGRAKWNTTMTNVLCMELAKSLVSDLDSSYMPELLEHKRIRGYQVAVEFKSARLDGLDLSFRSVGHAATAKAREAVKAGQLLSADFGVLVDLATIYANLGETDLAIETYGQALANELTQENLAVVRNNLGLLYGQKGDFQQAVDSYTEASRLQPALAQPHYSRALVEEALSHPELALSSAQRALELDPTYDAAATLIRRLSR